MNGRQGADDPTPAPSLAAMAEYVTGPGGSGVGPGPFDPESSVFFEHAASVDEARDRADR